MTVKMPNITTKTPEFLKHVSVYSCENVRVQEAMQDKAVLIYLL